MTNKGGKAIAKSQGRWQKVAKGGKVGGKERWQINFENSFIFIILLYTSVFIDLIMHVAKGGKVGGKQRWQVYFEIAK